MKTPLIPSTPLVSCAAMAFQLAIDVNYCFYIGYLIAFVIQINKIRPDKFLDESDDDTLISTDQVITKDGPVLPKGYIESLTEDLPGKQRNRD